MRRKYMLVMVFIFSSEKYKCLLFRVVLEAGQAAQPNTEFSRNNPCWGRLEHSCTVQPGNFSGQGAQWPALSRAGTDRQPGPGSRSQPQATEVNLHVQTREMSACGGTWISRRNLTFYVNKDSRLCAEVSREQRHPVLPAVKQACPAEAVGTTRNVDVPPARGIIGDNSAPLQRACPSHPWISDIFLTITKETLLRANPRQEQKWSLHLRHLSKVTGRKYRF